MRRTSIALLLSALLGCDGETPFGQRPPTAKIVGPNIAAKNTDIFFSAQITSSVGIDSLKWSILSATADSGATIVEQLGPLVRVRATGEGQVTLKLEVSDFNGIAASTRTIDLKDRILGRTVAVPGAQPNTRVGEHLFPAGDLDNDGHNDIIASDPQGRVALKDSGFVELFLGDRDTGLEPQAALHIPDPEPENGNQFGASVTIGDINGDELPDLLVGAPGYDTRIDDNVGRVYLYLGADTGIFQVDPILLEIPNTDFSADVEGDRFGAAIVSADFNQDGLDDFAVSAPSRDRSELDGQEGGEIFVYLGNTEGIFLAPDSLLTRTAVETSLGAPEHIGEHLFVVDSVCGSPAPDLITQIPGYDRTPDAPDSGAVLVYCSGETIFFADNGPFFLPQGVQNGDDFGASVIAMGDFDLDQRVELAIGAPGRNSVFIVGAPGQEFTEIVGPAGSIRFGEIIASTDINVNGNNDLIVALPDDGAGKLLVYPGSPLGIEAPFEFVSPSAEIEEFGRSLLSVGDVDGDGMQDLAAGIPGAFGGGVRLIF